MGKAFLLLAQQFDGNYLTALDNGLQYNDNKLPKYRSSLKDNPHFALLIGLGTGIVVHSKMQARPLLGSTDKTFSPIKTQAKLTIFSLNKTQLVVSQSWTVSMQK